MNNISKREELDSKLDYIKHTIIEIYNMKENKISTQAKATMLVIVSDVYTEILKKIVLSDADLETINYAYDMCKIFMSNINLK